jgi:branched-chain amino acid transport system permease protein
MPSAFSSRPVEIAGVAFSIEDLAIIGVSIGIVIVLYLFFQFTKLGLALRASAINPNASRLLGVRVPMMLAVGWGFAAVLSAIAGLMAAPALFVFTPNFMQVILIYAFAAAVLGGIESPVGAVVGGLALGVTINLLGTYVDFVTAEMQLPVALAILLTVLVLRPNGLFGARVVRRV